jgi:uncharacterized protein
MFNFKSIRMSNYHEPAEELSAHARDISRALVSLKEEVEAVDWYNQRMDVSKNEDLKRILGHNRDEEIEHACMTLEWLRKNMPGWDEQLRKQLFRDEENGSGSSNLSIGKIK